MKVLYLEIPGPSRSEGAGYMSTLVGEVVFPLYSQSLGALGINDKENVLILDCAVLEGLLPRFQS